jgi:hypothetical protein
MPGSSLASIALQHSSVISQKFLWIQDLDLGGRSITGKYRPLQKTPRLDRLAAAE